VKVGRRAWAIAALSVIALFFAYLRVTSTQPVNSDAAGNALEAWAMLHGNWLLRGWSLTDVSFYTTELPEYALVEVARGLRPEVMHISAAFTYTLIVILAALIAFSAHKGAVAVLAAAMAAVIILVPQPGEPTALVLSTPDHTGTAVPVLATLLLLDRAPRRWWTAGLTAVLLAWALIADQRVLVVAVAPLAIVCLVRAGAVVVRREPIRSAWYELALTGAAVVGTGVAAGVTHLIKSAGGWTLQPVVHQFVASSAMSHNTWLTAEGLLALFGADFFGLNIGMQALFALIHLAGVALVAAAVWLTLRRHIITGDFIAAVMAVAIALNIAAYMVTFNMHAINTTREIAPVMGLGAALAGRVMAGRLAAPGWRPVLAAGLACYLIAAVVVIAQSTPAPAGSQLTAWLEAHNLRSGLAGYWDSSSVVLESGGAVQMGTLGVNRAGLLRARHWENDIGWFDPRNNHATFVVTIKNGKPPSYITQSEALRTFGQPSTIYLYGGRIIMVYNWNLLTGLAPSP
jgi:hypothetical protein